MGEEFIPLGNSQFASTIANVQKAKPDFLVEYLAGANQSQFYPQANAAGLDIPPFRLSIFSKATSTSVSRRPP